MSNNQFVKSITNALTDDLTPLPELSQTLTNGSLSSSSETWFTWQNVIIIILILALLGLNIFTYLAKGTSDIASILRNIFGPLLSFFGIAAVDVTNQAVQGAAQGTTAVASAVAGASQTTSDVIKGSSIVNDKSVDYSQTTLNKALQDASQTTEPMPDDSASSIQKSTTGKAGWCYIGEENGTRSCAKVGINDTCMSGDIFPSQDICINPNLRP